LDERAEEMQKLLGLSGAVDQTVTNSMQNVASGGLGAGVAASNPEDSEAQKTR